MDETLWSLMTIIGPLILLILLLWLVLRGRSRRRDEPPQSVTEAGTRAEYAQEERMRREGTDDVEPRG